MPDSQSGVYPLEAVRTLALYAQGLTTANGSEPEASRQAIADLVNQLVCVQIDTLQRVQRSHYLAIWSRLGSYSPADLDALIYGDPADSEGDNNRQLFEFWFHAACLLPLSEFRFRLPRMQSSRLGRRERQRRWLAKAENQQLLTEVYERIKQEGGLLARDFKEAPKGSGTWWNWKPAKSALEHLFDCGDLLIADRKGFQRVYDLAERVLPDWVDRRNPGAEATKRHILERTLIAAGICAQNQLSDYCHDYQRTEAAGEIQALIEQGVFKQVSARLHDGEVQTLILHRDRIKDLERCADGEIKPERTTFLNPFDSLFYLGDRDERFWGFNQVLEAYKPADKRIYGYYCLPILYRSELIGRFDPRLDRNKHRLHIEALHLQAQIELKPRLINAVAETMRDFMTFHGANDIVIEASDPTDFGEALISRI